MQKAGVTGLVYKLLSSPGQAAATSLVLISNKTRQRRIRRTMMAPVTETVGSNPDVVRPAGGAEIASSLRAAARWSTFKKWCLCLDT